MLGNGARGRRRGVEAWGDLLATRDWRLVWGAVAMSHRFEVEPGRADLGGGGNGNDPERTAIVRSLWNVTPNHELDLTLRHWGELPSPQVPSYTVLDARLGWRVSPHLALSLAIANVFDRGHGEFGTPQQRAVLGRTAFLRATWTP